MNTRVSRKKWTQKKNGTKSRVRYWSWDRTKEGLNLNGRRYREIDKISDWPLQTCPSVVGISELASSIAAAAVGLSSSSLVSGGLVSSTSAGTVSPFSSVSTTSFLSSPSGVVPPMSVMAGLASAPVATTDRYVSSWNLLSERIDFYHGRVQLWLFTDDLFTIIVCKHSWYYVGTRIIYPEKLFRLKCFYF